MNIQIETLWQNWLMTMMAGLTIMVMMLAGFAAFGLLCGVIHEFCTRKEETERRKKEAMPAMMEPVAEWSSGEQEAQAMPAFQVSSGLSVVADVQRAIPMTAPGYRR